MYTIDDFLTNKNKIAIIKDGSPEWAEIAQELRDRSIQLWRDSDLDADPDRGIVFGHMSTNYIQSASLKALRDVGYTNIFPQCFVLAPQIDPDFLNDLL